MLTIVSGFQRCGSSLMMQMLSAGGMPVFHDPEMGYPSFETKKQFEADDRTWLTPLDAYAVKWLEPQHARPPAHFPYDVRTIWLSRDSREQAKSAVKFMKVVGGFQHIPDHAWKLMAKSYRTDGPKALAIWDALGPVLIQTFEELIHHPEIAAQRVCRFVDRPLDVSAMIGEVRPRHSQCLTGLLEAELMIKQRNRGI